MGETDTVNVSSWDPRRVTFVALGVQYLVNALVYSTYIARLPDLRESTGLSLAALGLVITVGNVAALAVLPLCPPLIRWGGSKWVMVVAALVYVGTLPALGLASSPAALVIAVIVMMVANTIVDVALARQSAVFSAQAERPVLSRLAGIYSVGALVGAGVAAQITHLGVNATTHLTVVSAVLVLALVSTVRGLLGSGADPAPGGDRGRVGWRGHTMLLLTIAVLSAAAVPLDVGPGEWATFRVREDLGLSSGLATGAYGAFVAGTCLGRFLGDHAAHALGRVRIWYVSIGCSLTGIAIACLIPHAAAAYGGFAVAGLGAAVQAPLLTEAAGRGPAAALTAFFLGNRLAGPATPVTIGALANTPSLGVGLAIVAVTAPCVALLSVLGRRAFVSPRDG
jgi:MFS family permease